MPIRPLLLLLLLFQIPYNIFCQQGTLIIAAITDENIIMAADSRVSIYENGAHSGVAICSIDSFKKIYNLKQFVLGMKGVAGIGKKTYGQMIEDFNKNDYCDTGVTNTLDRFIGYLDSIYPLQLFPIRKLNEFILCGYVNKQPRIAIRDSYNTRVFYSGTVYSDPRAEKYAQKILSSIMPASISIYDKLESTIYNCAAGENTEVTIGGPISIVTIGFNNKVTFVKNDFSNRSNEDFIEKIRSGQIKVKYWVPNGKERLLRVLDQ